MCQLGYRFFIPKSAQLPSGKIVAFYTFEKETKQSVYEIKQSIKYHQYIRGRGKFLTYLLAAMVRIL